MAINPSDMPNPMRDWARYYAQIGLRVFPLPAGMKAPGGLGISSATTDLAQIDAWWDAQPDANIAAVGAFRIDVDTKHNGMANWAVQQEKHGAAPTTRTVRTPSGGLHLWFRTDRKYGNSEGSLPDGINVRGHDTGYCVMPPSWTCEIPGKQSEGRYEWIDVTAPIAPAPQWLLDTIGAPPVCTETNTPALIEASPMQLADLRSALLSEGMLADWSYQKWSSNGLALLSLGDVGRELFCEYSDAQLEKLGRTADETAESWWHKNSHTRPNSDYLSIFKRAKALGWSNPMHSDPSRFGFGKGPHPVGMSLVPIQPRDVVPAGTDEPAPSEHDPRPVILLRGGEFNRYTVQAEKLLADTIYVHGHGLVRVGRAAEISNDALLDATGTKREAAQAVCISASAGWLRRELMDRAQFWKFDKRAREWERRDCPKEIAENIADQQAWGAFRPLVALSPVPVLRADMSLWTEPGYDALTGVYHQPTITMPSIPAVPTHDDALRALTRLLEPFNEFPYASRDGLAVFASHIITAVLRPSFDTAPIYLYTSPMAATGKTLLASMANIIANGATPAHSPYSESEELRKVLFSSLLAGDAALTLDNVPNGQKVRAPGLCVFATSSTYSDRILGASENRKVPNRCTVVLTGNNITPMSDLARRSIVCRLDANAESARGRKFRIRDLRGHVRQQRAQHIVDVLTIARAYAFAGRPEVAHPLESFEQWSRLVRDPLVWLGMADPVASQETETDDEVAPLQAAFTALAAATQAQGWTFTTAQLAQMTVAQPAPLREALTLAGCAEPADPKKLGYWLREQKDRVASGMKLVSERGAHGGVTSWRLRSV